MSTTEVRTRTIMRKDFANVYQITPDAGAQPALEGFSDVDPSVEYQPWGASNDYPTLFRKKVEASTSAYPLIAKSVGIQWGRGICYYKVERKDGRLEFTFQQDNEVDEFLRNNDADFAVLERMMDYKFTGNIFGEFILSKDGKKITNYSHLEAEFSRLGAVNSSTNKIDELWYTSNWEEADKAARIPYLSRRDISIENIVKVASKKKKFAVKSSFPSPGNTVYAVAPNAALSLADGWLDYANSVPKIMNSINKNAMHFKYHIQIPYSYWSTTIKGWEALDQAKRDKHIDAKLTAMDEWFVGTKNAHKSFISHFATDPATGKPLPGWSITLLDDAGRKDIYLTSVQEADSQIARALNIDTSLSGIQAQGGKLGAGSGSDKKEGLSNQITMSRADESIIMHFLKVVQLYNGWDPEYQFGFLHDHMIENQTSPTE